MAKLHGIPPALLEAIRASDRDEPMGCLDLAEDLARAQKYAENIPPTRIDSWQDDFARCLMCKRETAIENGYAISAGFVCACCAANFDS